MRLFFLISKGILISISIPFVTIFLMVYVNASVLKSTSLGWLGIFLFIIINLLLIVYFLKNDSYSNNYKKNKPYLLLLLLSFFFCSLFFILFPIIAIFEKSVNFIAPFFINLASLLGTFFYSCYIYLSFAVYKKEKIFLAHLKKFTVSILLFFCCLVGVFYFLSFLNKTSVIWNLKIFEYSITLLLGYGFSFYLFNFLWTIHRWYKSSQNKNKKFSKIPFKLILTILNYPFIFFCYLTFKNHYFSPEYDILKRRYQLFLPFAYMIIILTPFFQLYIWWGHDKLASFLKDKKIKKESLKINQQ